ncbi:hypothetical protein EDB86DRAFT_3104460 [Lactarius hatsudake]|nr:hypothetical protein EDB86DRAFT_3104460 [Lactarius hatsudake]
MMEPHAHPTALANEHCPPMLICERVFKFPGVVLRTAFTPLHFRDLLPLVPGLHLPAPLTIRPEKGRRTCSSSLSARHSRSNQSPCY